MLRALPGSECAQCSEGLASSANRPHQEAQLVPLTLSSSENRVRVGQLLSSLLTKLFPTGCPKGFYGKHCRKKCHCANRGRCHRLYGACLCDPGLYGRFCHLGELYTISVCMSGTMCFALSHTAGSTMVVSVDGLACSDVSAGVLYHHRAGLHVCGALTLD